MELTLVTGATGTQGGAVARLLLDRGHRVRALTRTPDSPRATELRTLGAEVVPGDFDDDRSLAEALRGVDRLFAVTTPFGTDLATETRQGLALLDAAKHVEHIVFTSACNADRDTGIPHFESKRPIEDRLRDHTVIGPAAFIQDKFDDWTLQGLREGYVGIPMPGDVPLFLIDVKDIAQVAVLALEQPARFAGKRIDLAGETLTPEQMAAVLTEALGRPIRHHRTPIAEVERFSTDVATMFRYFSEVGLEVDIPALRTTLPEVTWHRYADFVAARDWSDL
ncbi:NmrA/HSCARG family protein [Saccharothrix violaceirubra]|uniref:Uncharacterized protein YbjT (DUF2867 family) n=1 Tax=Saccharothrix violaceirubra TaxID=413306 RepID=A0A7W7T802_9PSEU|nr:NmrA/HSCARG family protein [Saccharothrix violaceirubra]MBB4968278.1 uncharacterized protein YbjT (DUF2867 family) [Saccharothrix violaceirubra]